MTMMVLPKQVIAEIMDRIVERPGHNMLAHEVIKKLDAAGYAVVPKEPTREMLHAAWRNVRDTKPDERMAVLLSDTATAHQVKMLRRWRAMLAAAPGARA